MDGLVDSRNGTISPAIFSHPDVYAQELEQIFARMWLFVGHESQVPNPGDFVRSRMGEEQVIVTRGRDNRIYVLLNSCPHRGNMVCRYDKGHGLAFQSSFHGWTFGSDGSLINISPGMEEEYSSYLRKEEWGMVRARVAIFHGTIWATWDESAPSFVEYLGGAEEYLRAALSDAEGDPDGLELAGGIMKWRVGMNWKVPQPDSDVAHGWITHRSARAAGFPFGSGGGASQTDDYHVWFPEGHTTSLSLPREGGEVGPVEWIKWRDSVAVINEYFRERAAKRAERLGVAAQLDELPHIFPNIGGTIGRIFRIVHPQGADASEMWSGVLVDKKAPPELKEAMVKNRLMQSSGPNGFVAKDDMENWYIQTRYSKGRTTRTRLRQNNQLGMHRPSLHGPTAFGLPGMFHRNPTDANYRAFFDRWAQVMEAGTWDEMRIAEPARVGGIL
jgi:nitrite reductase/ring-hydroxylating ferredoxin subunit